MSEVSIQILPASELHRIGEVDRREQVRFAYARTDAGLELREVNWDIQAWNDDPTDHFSVAAHVAQWMPLLEAGGVLIGAMHGDRMAGFAVLRHDLTPDTAQLAALYIDHRHRGCGVGRRLTARAESLAAASGAERLYVSAIPSQPTVDFYRRYGFELAEKPHAELFALEPDDIHLIKKIEKDRVSGE